MLGSKIASPIAHGFHTSTIALGQNLSNHRPARQYLFNHLDSPETLKLRLGLDSRYSWKTRSALMRGVDPRRCLLLCEPVIVRNSTSPITQMVAINIDFAFCTPLFAALRDRKSAGP